MINYSLHCENGHEFDGWFRDSAAFDEQAAAGVIACPSCGSVKVQKALMAPAVATDKKGGDAVSTLMPGGEDTEARDMLRKLREHVIANADDVGDKFAEEARRIHYKEAEERGIYGTATPDETRELRDAGIDVHPLPSLPDDKN